MGTLSVEEFLSCAQKLIEISDSLCDDWQLVQSKEDYYYLTKRANKSTMYTVEYHVLFSPSYSVPVMYLRVYNSAGEPEWSTDKVCDILDLPDDLKVSLLKQGLTQQPHPHLQTPFLQLHPCHTSKFMTSVHNYTNYLTSWLSLVGPSVGIYLDNQYNIK